MDEILGRVSGGENLTQQEMATAVDTIMRGDCSNEQIALLLTALHHKGETVEEIAGAAQAMRRHMTPIRTRHANFVDTCGTGGDASGTFNISTAAALVTAAAGVPVAKHGNRKITSKSGSADVLLELGVNIEASVATVQRCLDQLGIGFCFAPLLHPSMRHVAEVRQALGFPTIFNLLGPLSNPASAPCQLLGVGKAPLHSKLASALHLLKTERAVVVRGEDGLDEVTLNGPTRVILVEPEGMREFVWRPEDFGLTSAELSGTEAEGPAASAAKIRDVLAGKPGPARQIVILNAAAAIWTAESDHSPADCGRLAADAIDSGAASRLLQRLVEMSGS